METSLYADWEPVEPRQREALRKELLFELKLNERTIIDHKIHRSKYRYTSMDRWMNKFPMMTYQERATIVQNDTRHIRELHEKNQELVAKLQVLGIEYILKEDKVRAKKNASRRKEYLKKKQSLGLQQQAEPKQSSVWEQIVNWFKEPVFAESRDNDGSPSSPLGSASPQKE